MTSFDVRIQTINRCTAGHGAKWWSESFRMVKAAPFYWYFTGLFYNALFYMLLGALAYSSTGFYGERLTWLSVIVVPIFMADVTTGVAAKARGEDSYLFNGFTSNVFALLCVGVAMMLVLLAGSNFFIEMVVPGLRSHIPYGYWYFVVPMIFLVSVPTLFWITTWLAPIAVSLQRTGAARSLWSGLHALWVNWRAMTVYVLILVVAELVIVPLIALPMFMLPGKAPVMPSLVILLLVQPILTSLVMLSAYVAHCDIFRAGDV